MYLELVFTAFDLAYTVCYENFKAMKYMSAHSLFGRHVSNILKQDDLFKRWLILIDFLYLKNQFKNNNREISVQDRN